MFISERFCNPLLHFKMTKDDEMPKVEEMAAVRLTNILWETCKKYIGVVALTNTSWERLAT